MRKWEDDRIADVLLILIFLTIVVLKCVDVIKLSWLELSAIIWVPFLIGIALSIFMLVWFGISVIREKIKEKKQNEWCKNE